MLRVTRVTSMHVRAHVYIAHKAPKSRKTKTQGTFNVCLGYKAARLTLSLNVHDLNSAKTSRFFFCHRFKNTSVG